jgi:two-component system, chemotaxis family, protein-glutamate methylesterase/glutaminase
VAAPIRVLVVDDSALVRQILTRALSDDPRIEIVGTARNGVEALEKAVTLAPDVITLDVEMPELDGIEVLRHLSRHSDARVIMLSSVDDAATVYEALSLGAIDFVQKPTGGIALSIAELSLEMCAKIRTAFHVTPDHAAEITRSWLEGPLPEMTQSVARSARPLDAAHGTPLICVGIAASTGGPPALETVFSGLSARVPAAFVIVQHLPAGFSASLARRLSSRSDIVFVEAGQSMALEAGHAYIAPHGTHVRVVTDPLGKHRFDLTREDPIHGVRPSADPMLASLAERFGHGAVGVVLTGMGVDGASGCAAIAAVGGEVIVQDEATSVVWGMPRAVQHSCASHRAYPISLVADKIRRTVHERLEEVGR